MNTLDVDILTLERFSASLFLMIEGGPRVIDDGGYSSVDRGSNNTGGSDNDYDDLPDKDPDLGDVKKMNEAMGTKGASETPNAETQEEAEEESVFDKIKYWIKENHEKGKARVARERASEKLYEASEFGELTERNYKTANELKERADALREQAEGLNGEAAEKLNEKADSYEQRAEKYESRGEKYNGHKERMEKEAGDLNARSESIREKYYKKETYTRDELIAEQIRNGSPTTGVDAEVMNDLFGRTLSYDFIEQPV